MKWIIGLDIRPSSQGAIRFAAWLRRNARKPEEVELVGVHVLEHDFMMMALRRHHLEEVLDGARTAAREAVEAVGATDDLREVGVVRAMTAEQSLAGALQMHAADGVVIGRQAGRDEVAVVRLGRVARRLLRVLPGPVAVVPPDFLPSHIGDGPILCVARPADDAVGAVRAATDLASRLGRSVQLLHVVPAPTGLERLVPNANASEEILAADRREATLKLESWLREHELGDVAIEVVAGRVLTSIRQRARELGSPLIVCGSRRLSPTQRLFGSSVGSDLASACDIPVLVVPPDMAASA